MSIAYLAGRPPRHSSPPYKRSLVSILLAAGLIGAAALLGAPAACASQHARSPLAYVRTIVMPPVEIVGEPASARKAAPRDRGKRAAWERRQAERKELDALRRAAVASFQEKLRAYLGRTPGLSVVSAAQSAPGAADSLFRSRVLAGGSGERGRRPDQRGAIWQPRTRTIAAIARRHGTDAALAVAVDRFGATGRAQRQVWMRAVAFIVRAEDAANGAIGPLHALGRAETFRLPLLKRMQRSDADLAETASDQAARELSHALVTGVEPLFARDMRVAIIPASVPGTVLKRIEGGADLQTPVAPLLRQADVLFQPELSPVVEVVDEDDVSRVIRAASLQPADLWEASGAPDVPALQRIGRALGAEMVFLSRITDTDLTEHPILAPDSGAQRPGVERRAEVEAEGAMVSVEDGRALWKDIATGSTIARTEYVRHVPRLRTDEQCVVDAAREAYAYLRFSLEDMRRHLVR